MSKPKNKDQRMEIRVTSHQKFELEQIAEDLGWSTSKLLRYTIEKLINVWYNEDTENRQIDLTLKS